MVARDNFTVLIRASSSTAVASKLALRYDINFEHRDLCRERARLRQRSSSSSAQSDVQDESYLRRYCEVLCDFMMSIMVRINAFLTFNEFRLSMRVIESMKYLFVVTEQKMCMYVCMKS